MKYKIGDRVKYDGNSGTDTGIVTEVDHDGCSGENFIYVKWDSDGDISGFWDTETPFSLIETIPREIVKKVLRSYIVNIIGYNPDLLADETIDIVYQDLLKQDDPDYQQYLKLKARFEKE